MFTVVNSSESEWCCKATPEVPCRTQGFSHLDDLAYLTHDLHCVSLKFVDCPLHLEVLHIQHKGVVPFACRCQSPVFRSAGLFPASLNTGHCFASSGLAAIQGSRGNQLFSRHLQPAPVLELLHQFKQEVCVGRVLRIQ